MARSSSTSLSSTRCLVPAARALPSAANARAPRRALARHRDGRARSALRAAHPAAEWRAPRGTNTMSPAGENHRHVLRPMQPGEPAPNHVERTALGPGGAQPPAPAIRNRRMDGRSDRIRPENFTQEAFSFRMCHADKTGPPRDSLRARSTYTDTLQSILDARYESWRPGSRHIHTRCRSTAHPHKGA
jgi:hypothetical protein